MNSLLASESGVSWTEIRRTLQGNSGNVNRTIENLKEAGFLEQGEAYTIPYFMLRNCIRVYGP